MRTRILIFIGFTLAVLGCDASEENTPATTSSALVAELPEAFIEIESDQLFPSPVQKSVDQEEVSAFTRLNTALNDNQREAIDRSPVPVLVPDRPDLLTNARFMAGPVWYAVSIVQDGHGISIHASNRAYQVEGISEGSDKSPREDHGYHLTRSEGIPSITFPAFGIAYMIRIVCDVPFQDPRCEEDDYILSLADAMAVAGGLP